MLKKALPWFILYWVVKIFLIGILLIEVHPTSKQIQIELKDIKQLG